MSSIEACLHCEKKPGTHTYGLCSSCVQMPTVRHLYEPRAYHTEEFLAKLRRLRARAKAGEPLFPPEDRAYPLPHPGRRIA